MNVISKTKQLERRIKNYESVTKGNLINKLPVIVKITYENHKSNKIDFDQLHLNFYKTTIELCKTINNIVFSYYPENHQVFFLLKDWDKVETSSFLSGDVQKISSYFSSMFSSLFQKNYQREISIAQKAQKRFIFTANCFNLPLHEVNNYFIQQQRNSINQFYLNFNNKLLKEKKNLTELIITESVISNPKENNYGVVFFKKQIEITKTDDLPKSALEYYLKYFLNPDDHLTKSRSKWVMQQLENKFENTKLIEKFL